GDGLQLRRSAERLDVAPHFALVRRLLVHARNQHLSLRTGVGKRLVVDSRGRRTRGPGRNTGAGLLRQRELLRGSLIARIDLQSTREFVDGAAGVARLAQNAAAVDVLIGGLKAEPLVALLVTQVLGLLQPRLAIGLKRGVVVLPGFGVLTALVPCAGGLGVRRRGEEQQDKQQRQSGKRALCNGRRHGPAG